MDSFLMTTMRIFFGTHVAILTDRLKQRSARVTFSIHCCLLEHTEPMLRVIVTVLPGIVVDVH